MFAAANKFVSVMATIFGGASSSMLADSGQTTNLVDANELTGNLMQHILQSIYTFFYNIILIISAFALQFIDIIQLIIYKFLGLNFDLSGYKAYDPNNPLIKFIRNDTVTTVLRSALAVALVLVIVFSIYSIIRGEYQKAANDQEYSVKRVWARAFRAIFGMLIFPALFLGVVILTNAILSSFAYVLAGNNTTSIGNQVFAVSAYNANTYRNYANNNRRIPIYVDFEDPYDLGYGDRYSSEELVQVYDAFVNQGTEIYNMFADQTFPTFAETYTYVNNSLSNNNAKYNNYEKFVCTREQYYVMAEFIDYALANNVQFYYKAMTDADIDWKYVDASVFDNETKTLTITYRDMSSNDGKVYTVQYKPNNYLLTSPVQDAITSVKTLLSLDGTKYKMLDYIEGSINRVEWATNKVKIKLSENYATDRWSVSDQIILYEYYRWKSNNTFQKYTIDDLAKGVYIDLYTLDLQFFRTYQNEYITLASFDTALINGTYYKVRPLAERDEYGDVIYALDTTECSDISISDLSWYNKDLPDEDKLGVHIPDRDNVLHNRHDGSIDPYYTTEESWYSATFDEFGTQIQFDDTDGNYHVGNTFEKAMINIKGRKFAESTTDGNARYGYMDANGFYKEVERTKATKSVKEVSWPTKLIGDIKAIYRDLNINQLITTGEWLETFESKLKNVSEYQIKIGTDENKSDDIINIIKNMGLNITSHILTQEFKVKINAAGVTHTSGYYDFSNNATARNQEIENIYNAFGANGTGVDYDTFKYALSQYIVGSEYRLDDNDAINVIVLLGSDFAVARLYGDVKSNIEAASPAILDGTYYLLSNTRADSVYNNFKYNGMTINFADYGFTRTNWLELLNRSVGKKEQEYVASFDNSLISPQGLIFSEIFLSEIVESDGSTLGNYMFKSKYTKQQQKAMLLSLLGEEYFETASITIDYFVDTFNQLFEPLLEKIMAGESQPMTVGEVMNIQLYTYKAYLASVLLSDDNAKFMLDIARGFVDMYAFSYDILLADPNNNSFALSIVREYADMSYGDGDGDIPYAIKLEDLGIDWKDYFSDEDKEEFGSDNFRTFLRSKFGLNETGKTQLDIAQTDVSTALLNAISNATKNIYKTYADIILTDNILQLYEKSDNNDVASDIRRISDNTREDLQYGLVWTFEEGGTAYELGEYLKKYGYTYDYNNNYIIKTKTTGNKIEKIYHTWSQLPDALYNNLKQAVYNITKADLTAEKPQTRFAQLLVRANKQLADQHITEDKAGYPAYLKIFKAYITNEETGDDSIDDSVFDRREIIYSRKVGIDRIEGIQTEYKDYVERLANAQSALKSIVGNDSNPISAATYLLNKDKMKEFVDYYYDKIGAYVADKGFDIDKWRLYANEDAFWAAYNKFVNGSSNNEKEYQAQLAEIDKFVDQVEHFYQFFFNGLTEEEKEEKRNSNEFKRKYQGLSCLYNYSTIVQNILSNQQMVDSFHKYFLTYSVRMQATERASKMFTVIVNNRAYNLSITMPTAKIVEYVLGGRYLASMSFETMFVDSDYTGFLDIGYEGKLPKTSDKITFGTINKFLNNLATITVESYYASNFRNITDSNNDNVAISKKYYVSYEGKQQVVDNDDGQKPTFMTLILNYMITEGMLDNDLLPNTPLIGTEDRDELQALFNDVMTYLTNSARDYSSMSMKEIRLEMFDSLYNYQTYTGDSAEADSKRYLALFRLFCSDFEYKTESEIKYVEYVQNQASKSIMMRLAGLKDKPEETIVNLQYKNLYDNIGYDEQFGDYFIMCSFEESTQSYYPILMIDSTQNSYKEQKVEQYYIKSDICVHPSGSGAFKYPIIAKGILDEDGYPTAIRQINGVTEFYRKNVIIRNASELGLSSYYMSVEQVSVNMGLFARFTNALSKIFTGKTLIEHAYSGRTMLRINSYFSFPMGVTTKTTKLTSEGVSMHYYNMMMGISFSGLSATSFYSTLKIDIIILLFAILALIPMLLKALWGVFGRVVDVTIYYMASPVAFSTMALGQDVKKDKGEGTTEDIRIFNDWRKTIFKKTLSVFGYVFAFQMFFIIVPYIYTQDLIKNVEIFKTIRMFSWVEVAFVNQVLRVIFIICSVYLVTTAPKLFAEIMNQDDGIAEGEKMQRLVKETINETKNAVSGQNIVDAANFAREEIKQMIPGYDIAVAMKEKYQETKARAINAVAQVAGTVMKFIPQTAAYADAVKKAGKEYKEQTLKLIEAKKALRMQKRAEADRYLEKHGVDESSRILTASENKMLKDGYGAEAQQEIMDKYNAKKQDQLVKKIIKKRDKKEKKKIIKQQNKSKQGK